MSCYNNDAAIAVRAVCFVHAQCHSGTVQGDPEASSQTGAESKCMVQQNTAAVPQCNIHVLCLPASVRSMDTQHGYTIGLTFVTFPQHIGFTMHCLQETEPPPSRQANMHYVPRERNCVPCSLL